MYNVTRLVDVADAERDRVHRDLLRLAERCGAARHLVAPTLPGSRNGGDLLLHLRFDDEAAWVDIADQFAAVLRDPAISRVNGVGYRGRAQTIPGRGTGTVYRTLMLRVEPGTDSDTLARFEADLQLLPGHVSTIAAWQLSRPDHTVGASEWTHVFEQEFSDADGIMGAYLMHPIHWAVVDQWFDPECPKVIVRERVCHSFCLDSTRVLR
ncbi:Dabb family protein [Mycobacterium sp. NAZ190054]|uniref:Dabb family protein n=1 Tax=Mycobacterium sp. NAZ190054 TaxID=1747766 RepID=UPI00079110D0|nr:Dabb family protein [Mycobacterium sp. NAZ190054]KWX66323.1 stress responsive protein [Mycobacterium sp. NAZ190054]